MRSENAGLERQAVCPEHFVTTDFIRQSNTLAYFTEQQLPAKGRAIGSEHFVTTDFNPLGKLAGLLYSRTTPASNKKEP